MNCLMCYECFMDKKNHEIEMLFLGYILMSDLELIRLTVFGLSKLTCNKEKKIEYDLKL